MAPTIVILADGLANAELSQWLGPAEVPLITSIVHDTVAVARSVHNGRVLLRYRTSLPSAVLAGLDPDIATAPLRSFDSAELGGVLRATLAAGDVVLLLSADVPHLPPWRLRDALTHLREGNELVVGPSEQGDWYLLGLRTADAALLDKLPKVGEAPTQLVRAAREQQRRAAILPPWFGIRTRDDLDALAEELQTMPYGVAVQTRTFLDSSMGFARAVGG